MPARSCEQHVFIVKETIKYRLRRGLDTYLGLVDARRAYDSVSPSAMFALLERLGAPAKLMNSLRAAYATRRRFFTFNGSVVDTWTQKNGLSTGSVLSPLFYNIFVECLARFIEAVATITGVSIASAAETVTVKLGMFADDVQCMYTQTTATGSDAHWRKCRRGPSQMASR